MKKLALIMIVIFFSFGCGSKSNDDNKNNDSTNITQKNVIQKDTIQKEIVADKEEVKNEIKKEEIKVEKQKVEKPKEETPVVEEKKLKVTFIELGSVNCIPCKQMQPVMKAIESKYGEQVDVVFYDVWQEDQKQYAQKYGIRVIPTQVFLDENGVEFHRHEGFYPEAAIDQILQNKGLTIK